MKHLVSEHSKQRVREANNPLLRLYQAVNQFPDTPAVDPARAGGRRAIAAKIYEGRI